MLTPLFKKSKHVGTVEFLSTLVFGIVGLAIFLVEDIPKSFVWLVSPLCQCTFLIGVAQVSKIHYLHIAIQLFMVQIPAIDTSERKTDVDTVFALFYTWSKHVTCLLLFSLSVKNTFFFKIKD